MGETYAMIKALNKLTGFGVPKTYRIDWETHKTGDSISKLNYATKPSHDSIPS